MASLLFISASPKGPRSASNRLAEVFLEELARIETGLEVDRLPLFETDLPEFGEASAEAKFAPFFGTELTSRHDEAWAPVKEHIARFDAADRILLASPMWNYSIPYRLKHYLDLIMQPRETFSYNPETMQHYGLLANRPVQFILTRSSIRAGDMHDYQLPYLQFAFDAMGLRDLRVITVAGTTKPTQEERDAFVASFEDEVRAAASKFAVS